MSKKITETGNLNSKKEIENLSGYEFFANFSRDEISLLLLCAEKVSYEKGEIIFREKDIGLHFYAVLSGDIIIRREKSGRKIRTLKPGQIFGEMAVLDGHPRSASAIAASRVELYAFDGRRLLDNFPFLSVKLLRFMARNITKHLREADELIDNFL